MIKSPFLYYSDLSLKRIQKKGCSYILLMEKKASGDITSFLLTILCALLRYGYLNSYLLEKVLKNDNVETNKKAIRYALKDLVELGLACQWILCRDGIEKGAYIYSITNSGYHFLKKLGLVSPGVLPEKELPLIEILETLCYNQFHISLESDYGKSGAILQKHYHPGKKKSGYYLIKLENGKPWYLFPVAIRSCQGYGKRFLNQLRELATIKEERAIILVIVESDEMAMNCERYRCCEMELKDLVVYYVTEVSLIEEGTFNQLTEISPQENYSKRKVFQLPLYQRGKETAALE